MTEQQNPKFEVRNSAIAGKGLFAATFIKKGEAVLSWHPKELSRDEADALPASEKHYLYPDGDIMLYMLSSSHFSGHLVSLQHSWHERSGVSRWAQLES